MITKLNKPESFQAHEVENEPITGKVFAGIEGSPSKVQVGSKIKLNLGVEISKIQSQDLPVSVSIRAPGFIMNGRRDLVITKKFVLQKGMENITKVLKFQAISPGKHKLEVDFFSGNGYLTTIEIPITVIN